MRALLEKLLARQARLMSALDATEEALSPAPSVARNDTAAESAALGEADSLLQAGRIDEARSLLEPLEAGANFARTLTVLARISALAGDDAKALERLQAAERVDPMDQSSWRLLADAMQRRGLYEAELIYRRKLVMQGGERPAASTVVAMVRALVLASQAWSPKAAPELRSAIVKLRAASDLQGGHLLEAAQALYAGSTLQADAKALYLEAAPCPSTHADVSAQWVSMHDWCDRHAAPFQRNAEVGQPGRRAELAELTNALVSPLLHWTPVLDNGKTLLSGFERTSLPLHIDTISSPLLLSSSNSAELRLPTQRRRESRRALLLGGHPDNFRHLADYLGALAVAQSLGADDRLPVVIDARLSARQLEQLEHLGIAGERLITVRPDEWVQFDQLCVPTRLSSGSTWMDPTVPAWLRRTFAASREVSASPRRLFLHTGGPQDDIEIREQLAHQGFDTLDVASSSVAAWSAALGTATHVVAVLGPALADAALCAPGAVIVALCDQAPNPEVVSRHQAWASACGHELRLVRNAAPSALDLGALTVALR